MGPAKIPIFQNHVFSLVHRVSLAHNFVVSQMVHPLAIGGN